MNRRDFVRQATALASAPALLGLPIAASGLDIASVAATASKAAANGFATGSYRNVCWGVVDLEKCPESHLAHTRRVALVGCVNSHDLGDTFFNCKAGTAWLTTFVESCWDMEDPAWKSPYRYHVRFYGCVLAIKPRGWDRSLFHEADFNDPSFAPLFSRDWAYPDCPYPSDVVRRHLAKLVRPHVLPRTKRRVTDEELVQRYGYRLARLTPVPASVVTL